MCLTLGLWPVVTADKAAVSHCWAVHHLYALPDLQQCQFLNWDGGEPTHSLCMCVCVSVSEDTTGSRVSRDLLNISEDHKLPNMPIASVEVPCGVSVYVLSLIFHQSSCLHAWNVHVYVCICICVFYVADLKLFNGNAFSAAVLSVPARYFSVKTNSIKYSAHGSVMPHLSQFMCVWCFTENEGWQDLWKGWDKHSWFTARWGTEHHWGLATLW